MGNTDTSVAGAEESMRTVTEGPLVLERERE